MEHASCSWRTKSWAAGGIVRFRDCQVTREPSKPSQQSYEPNSCDCLQAGTAIDRELPQFGPLAGCRRTPSSGVLVSWFSSSLSPSLHGLSPDSTLLRDNPTSLPTSLRCRCLPSELPGCPGSAEIAWSKTMHFPGFRSLLNEPLGILGVVFSKHTDPVHPALRGFTYVQESVLFQASSPHVLAAHADAFDS